MALIEVKPRFLTDVELTIGVDQYENHVSGVTFTPTPASPSAWSGLGGNTHTAVGKSTTWVCTLDYVQDWQTPNSLARYLKDNAGVEKPCVFTPSDGSEPWYATITPVPGPLGGAGQAFATASVTLASTEPTEEAPAA